MGIILVGKLNGKSCIRWRTVLLLACLLGLFGASVAAATYFALCGQLSLIAAAVGFIGPFITVVAGMLRALRLPVEQLISLDQPIA